MNDSRTPAITGTLIFTYRAVTRNTFFLSIGQVCPLSGEGVGGEIEGSLGTI